MPEHTIIYNCSIKRSKALCGRRRHLCRLSQTDISVASPILS